MPGSAIGAIDAGSSTRPLNASAALLRPIDPVKHGYDMRWDHVLNETGKVIRTRVFHKTEGFWGESLPVPQLGCTIGMAEQQMLKLKAQYLEQVTFQLGKTPYRWNLMGIYTGPLAVREAMTSRGDFL